MRRFLLKKQVLGFFLFLSTINLWSQTPTFTDSGISLPGVSYGSVAWGDYDNDGDLDILLSGYPGSAYITKIYKNDGNNSFTEQTGIILTGIIYGSANWGDYDNDGDLDILLSGYQSSTSFIAKIYKNNGNNSFTEQTGISLAGVAYGTSDWCDYDNDGDLDILLTGATSSTYPYNPISKIYRNDGDNIFTEQTTISLMGVHHSSTAWGDYDNDGDLDILLSGNTGSFFTTRIYKNNGGGSFTVQAITLTGVYDGSVDWGDYDNDGDLDILLSGSTGTTNITKIYKNNGSNSFTEQTGIILTGVSSSSAAWGDYDNDGDLDILLSGHTGSAYITKIYKNNSNNSFTEQTGITITGVYQGSLAWGDYDNDCDLDILLTGYTGSVRISKIYYSSGVTPNTKPLAPLNLQANVNNSTVTFTWDRATDIQTPQTGLDYNLYVYESGMSKYFRPPHAFNQTHDLNGRRQIARPGNIQWSSAGYILRNFSPEKTYYWSVQAVDGELMGSSFASEQSFYVPVFRPDVQSSNINISDIQSNQVNASWTIGSGTGRVLFIKEGSTGPADPVDNTTYSINSLTPSGWKCIYNGTGNSTIISGLTPLTEYNVHVCEYNGSPGNEMYLTSSVNNNPAVVNTAFSESAVSLQAVSGGSTNWGDYDNDGDLDILLTGYTGSAYISKIYKNNGDNSFTEQTGITLTGCTGPAAWGDYDNDGDLDILLTGYTGSAYISKIYKNNGDNSFTEQTGITLTGSDDSAAWGDYDNDGDLDILLSGYNGSGGSGYITKIYKNNGNNSFTEQTGITLTGVRSGSAVWGDYDNDGDLDILLTGISGTLDITKIYQNNGDNSFTEQTGITLIGLGYSSAAWGDYDNDCDLDILLSGRTGSTYLSKIFKNNGNSSFTEQTVITLTGVYQGSTAWGDYDNDGDLDILLTGSTGSTNITKIYKNNGYNSFTEQTGIRLTGVYQGSTAWGDYDNDGDLDILLSGYMVSGRLTTIYENNGTAINIAPTKPVGLVSILNNNSVTLKWEKSADTRTPSNGLTYNLRRGSGSNKVDYQSPMALLNSGFRLIPAMGNMLQDTSITLPFRNLAIGTNYWSVQAIDNTFAGSEFSAESVLYNIPPTSDFRCISRTSNIDTIAVTYTGNASQSALYQWDFDGAELISGTGGGPYLVRWNTVGEKQISLYVQEAGLHSDTTIRLVEVDVGFSEINAGLVGLYDGSTAWGDYDNDGDLDILLSGDSSYIKITRIYQNRGDNKFILIPCDFMTGTNAGGYRSSASWGDYDNDGDLDVILLVYITKLEGTVIFLYTNNGDGSFSEKYSALFEGIYHNSLLTGDYNNDGYLDFMVAGGGGGTIFKNFGNYLFVKQCHIEIPGLSSGSTTWADYDNDGDLDILFTGSYQSGATSKLYKNNGDDTFTEQTPISLPGVHYSSVAWADYDNDGMMDLLISGDDGNYNYLTKLFKYDKINGFVEQTGISLPGVRYSAISWGDYDNDGDLDILQSGQTDTEDYTSKIFRNNGNNTFTENTDITLEGIRSGSVAWGDYDNDRDLDIIISGNTNTGSITKVYRNDGSVVNTAPSAPIGLMSELVGDNVILSWNKSKDRETPENGITYNMRRGSDTNSIDYQSPMADIGSGYRLIPAMGNMGLDTVLSVSISALKVGTNFWSVQAIDNTFSGSEFSEVAAINNIPPISAFKVLQDFCTCDTVVVRYNGNAADTANYIWLFEGADYVEGNKQGPYYVQWKVPGTYKIRLVVSDLGLYSDTTSITVNARNCFKRLGNDGSTLENGLVELVNIDPADDYLDIIISGHYVHFKYGDLGIRTWGYLNEGGLEFSLTKLGLPGLINGSIAFGDYDNDFDLDALVTGDAGDQTYISQVYNYNIIDETFYDIYADLPGIRYSSTAWGDYDNDGDLDILISGEGSNVNISKVYRNDGDTAFTDIVAGLTGVSNGSVAWGDYDNDLDLDILLTGSTYSKIYRNDGNGNFVQISTKLTGVSESSAAWGDYDEDGDLDILLTGNSADGNSISKIYRNDRNDIFTDINADLQGVHNGSAKWADYDTDGDLDVMICGKIQHDYPLTKIYSNEGNDLFIDAYMNAENDIDDTDTKLLNVLDGDINMGDFDNDGDLDIYLYGWNLYWGCVLEIYENKGVVYNKPPAPPDNLQAFIIGNKVFFKWAKSYDNETASDGLTYNISVGITPDGCEIISPMSYKGVKLIPNMGNTFNNTGWVVDISEFLPIDTIYWTVQAVDNTFTAGEWAEIQAFKIPEIRADFYASSVCLGHVTNFIDSTIISEGEISSWKWYFGDGDSSLIQNPSHFYAKSGIFYVQLTVNSNKASHTVVKPVTVKHIPYPNFIADVVCQGGMTTFLNTSNIDSVSVTEWLWDYGDGSKSNDQQPSHGYLSSGDYTVKLKAVASNSCADSVTNLITVGSYPVAAVTANAPLTFCRGDSVTLSVPYNDSYSYDWMVGGVSLTGGDSSSYTPNLTGSYSVKVVNPKGNCTTTSLSVAITALDAPAAPLITTGGAIIFCEGDSVALGVTNTAGYTYQWKLNGGAVGVNSYQHVAKSGGTYSLTVSNSSGCTVNSTNSVTVTVNPKPTLPTVSLSGPTIFCQGSSVDLSVTNNTGYTYQWENSGATMTGATTSSYTAQASGIYSLKITNPGGCYTRTDNVTVNVLTAPAAPLISASKALEFCQGDSVELSVTNTLNYKYQWKNNGGAVGMNSSKYIAKNSGKYNLTVTNENNCPVNSTDTVTVTVNPAPAAGNISLSGQDTFCEGGSVILSVPSAAGNTYKWKNETGVIAGAETSSYTAVTSGNYRLEVTNTTGCPAETTPVKITVKQSPAKPVITASNYTPGQCLGATPVRLEAGSAVQGYRYRWIKDGEPRQNDTLTHIEFYEKGIYKLRAQVGECQVESDAVTITLPDAPEKPVVYVKGPVVWYMAAYSRTATKYQWYRNDEQIQGATRYIYVANKTLGTYKVAVGNQNECYTMSDSKTIPLAKGAMTDFYVPPEYLVKDEADPYANIQIYPNPTTGIITIVFDNDILGELTIGIITEQGKEIRNISTKKTTVRYQTEIDLSGEPKGIYFINLKLVEYTTTRKVIIE